MKCCAYLGSMGLMHSLDVGRTTPSSFKVQYASTANEGEICILSARYPKGAPLAPRN